jgi:hypothetical protein
MLLDADVIEGDAGADGEDAAAKGDSNGPSRARRHEQRRQPADPRHRVDGALVKAQLARLDTEAELGDVGDGDGADAGQDDGGGGQPVEVACGRGGGHRIHMAMVSI